MQKLKSLWWFSGSLYSYVPLVLVLLSTYLSLMCQPTSVPCQPSSVSCQPSTVSCQPSSVSANLPQSHFTFLSLVTTFLNVMSTFVHSHINLFGVSSSPLLAATRRHPPYYLSPRIGLLPRAESTSWGEMELINFPRMGPREFS
jgi:hypothetical protein